jgi:tellurite methyltransferase
MAAKRSGGYEAGYAACDSFWGLEPGTYVRKLVQMVGPLSGMRALDVGCGEGKNAALLAKLGAEVTGVEICQLALEHAKGLHSCIAVKWVCADVTEESWPSEYFDIVIAYGLFHCMSSSGEIERLQLALSNATRIGGYHVICTFNDRDQDLSAHPGFDPCLAPHEFYLQLYRDWRIVVVSDENIQEAHPHNMIPHHHSLTRLLAQRIR